MEIDGFVLYLAAAVGGIVLQLLLRMTSRVGGKWGKLALALGKCAVLLAIQAVLLLAFSQYAGDGGHAGCLAASCVTFLIAAAALIMQPLYDRKYPMTDAQRMHLNEL